MTQTHILLFKIAGHLLPGKSIYVNVLHTIHYTHSFPCVKYAINWICFWNISHIRLAGRGHKIYICPTLHAFVCVCVWLGPHQQMAPQTTACKTNCEQTYSVYMCHLCCAAYVDCLCRVCVYVCGVFVFHSPSQSYVAWHYNSQVYTHTYNAGAKVPKCEFIVFRLVSHCIWRVQAAKRACRHTHTLTRYDDPGAFFDGNLAFARRR